jgi:hypothetical protein
MTARRYFIAEARSVGVRRIVGTVALILVAAGLLLAAVTWGPHLVRDYLASRVSAVIGREVKIGAIHVEPFRRGIQLTDFEVAGAAADRDPLLVVPEVSAQLDLSAALRGRVQLSGLRMTSPTARFARLAPGRFSFQDILDHLRANGDDTDQPVPFVLEEAGIENGTLVVRDDVADTSLQFLRLDGDLEGLTNQSDRPGPLRGAASFTFQGAPVEVTVQGAPLAESPKLRSHIMFSRLAVDTVAAYLPLGKAVRASGALAAAADVTYEAGNWTLAGGSLDLKDATLQDGPLQVAVVQSLKVDGLRLDFAHKLAAAQALRIDAARLKLIRDEQGRLPFMQLASAAGSDNQKASRVRMEAGSAGEAQGRWRYSLETAALADVQVEFVDQTLPAERRLPIATIDVRAENLSSDPSVSIPLHVSMVMEKEERISAQGSLQPMPFEFRGRVEASGFGLSHFEPYLGLLPNLSLVSAGVWGEGDVEIAADAQRQMTAMNYYGELSINDVLVLDNVLDTEFVRWSALVAPEVSVEWQPATIGDTRIDVGDIAFVDFFGRAILDEEGQLNLKYVLDPSQDEADPDEIEIALHAESPNARDGRLFVTTGTLRVASGHINFTDNFVEPKYTVDLTQLSGSITGVATDQREPATISIEGLVNGEAPLQIEGKINLLAPQPMLDLQATAHDIELTQLSPYAVRWAGYAIESGTLSAEVHYQIEGSQLDADNQLVLHELKLGEKVESSEASDLPLRLALSLLRDREGNVSLNLPISGSLTDPEFSFPGLVSRAMVGLFRKVATAPFSFLASIAGGGESGGPDEAADQGLDFVRFPAGRSALEEDQLRKLRQLAAALENREAVGLQVIGYVDRTADREGLREERLESALNQGSEKVETAGEAGFAASTRRERLLALYRQWGGGAISTEGLETSDLEKLLLERIEISEAELLILARRRGVSVIEALSEAGLDSERIKLLAPQFASDSRDLPASRAQLEIVERKRA